MENGIPGQQNLQNVLVALEEERKIVSAIELKNSLFINGGGIVLIAFAIFSESILTFGLGALLGAVLLIHGIALLKKSKKKFRITDIILRQR